MKSLLTLILALAFCSCTKEKIREKQANLIMDAMVNGQWKVTSFNRSGTDITADFSAYKFQFKDNYTVDAINNGTVENSGTWNADPDKQTITSNFLNVGEPLLLLNGTWLITNSTWTSVQARQTLNGEIRNLRLDKL